MLLDSSSWIELFKGSFQGKKVEEIVESVPIYTSIVSLAEIAKWCIENKADIGKCIRAMEENSTIFNLKKNIIIEAGVLTAKRKKIVHNWGMIDSIIYATAQFYNLTVLTSDHHFENLENVQII